MKSLYCSSRILIDLKRCANFVSISVFVLLDVGYMTTAAFVTSYSALGKIYSTGGGKARCKKVKLCQQTFFLRHGLWIVTPCAVRLLFYLSMVSHGSRKILLSYKWMITTQKVHLVFCICILLLVFFLKQIHHKRK